jgi:hypothetical protein
MDSTYTSYAKILITLSWSTGPCLARTSRRTSCLRPHILPAQVTSSTSSSPPACETLRPTSYNTQIPTLHAARSDALFSPTAMALPHPSLAWSRRHRGIYALHHEAVLLLHHQESPADSRVRVRIPRLHEGRAVRDLCRAITDAALGTGAQGREAAAWDAEGGRRVRAAEWRKITWRRSSGVYGY